MTSPELISVNVGLPRDIEVRDAYIRTAIFKSPVEGRVAVRDNNLAGDGQADLTVHGGPDKAVYCYSAEHYPYWASQIPDADLPFGAFGENLTVDGLTEDSVRIGDRLRVGTVVLRVTQPRMPCFKLALRFARADMVKRFWSSNRSGYYCAVEEEGELGRGDVVDRTSPEPDSVTIAEVLRIYRGDEETPDLLRRVLRSSIAGSWKAELQERWLARHGSF